MTATAPTRVIVPLAVPPDATIVVPGSKSLTNRALAAAALAHGTTQLDGALFADDTEAMLGALRALGMAVEADSATNTMRVSGQGGRIPPGPAAVHVRSSGTTARFMAPLLALGEGPYHLDGSAQMRRRPMGPTFDALRALGATVDDAVAPGHLPATIHGGPVRGGAVSLPGDTSSQFLSGLLLAAPAMRDGLELTLTTQLVSRPYVDLTIAVMGAFGVTVERPSDDRFVVPPGTYEARTYAIEPDASAASYFLAAAAITGGRVRVPGLGDGALQGDAAFAEVLASMGARVERTPDAVTVTATGRLHGVDVDLRDLSDTAQTLAVTAAFADTPTRVRGIGFIRAKETDRIAAVVRELQRCGIGAVEESDGFVVHPGPITPARIETYDDHRMAMSFALLGLVVPGIEIVDPDCVAKTFPGYWEALELLRRGGE